MLFRSVPVRYKADQAPYDTSPADIVAWLTDHYREHVPHIAKLAADAPKT